MAMEALFHVCSNSLFSSIQNHKIPMYLPFPASASLSFGSQSKSQSWVSLKLHVFHDLPPFVVSKKREVQCLSSDEQLATSNGVRQKNLAVFVSGGGSNFRAVHQATLNGNVHGRFVVLVTNKHDCGGAQYAKDNGLPVIIYPSAKGEPKGLSTNGLVTPLST